MPSSRKPSPYRPYVIRFLLVIAGSLILTAAFNEAVYLVQKGQDDRPPQTIELVIPAGTAQRVQAGEDVPSIPAEMVFVLGDTLEVKNQDTVSHQLGPIWVPPGGTGKLIMQQAADQVVRCSFTARKYLGLNVKQATTIGTRLAGLAITGPTFGMLVFLYSLLIFPVDGKKKASLPSQRSNGKLPGGASNGSQPSQRY